jgi:hypothetical protein
VGLYLTSTCLRTYVGHHTAPTHTRRLGKPHTQTHARTHGTRTQLESLYDGDLKKPMEIFKAAQLFNPCVASTLDYQDLLGKLCQHCQHIRVLGLNNLLAEIPTYLQAAATVAAALPDADILKFWRNQHAQGNIPSLCAALRVLLLYHPTSATAERVFSFLNAMIDDRQTQMLDDMMSESIKQRYHSQGNIMQLYRKKASYQGVWDFVQRNVTPRGHAQD